MSEFSKELQITAEFCQERHLNAFAKHIPLAWVVANNIISISQ
jgi:hypothetical protein